MRRILLAALLTAGAALAGLGDGFGGGATGAAGAHSDGAITYPRIVNVQVGGYVSVTPTVTGITPGTYTLQAGSLPDGLSLNSSTGAITGSTTVKALLWNNRTTSIGKHTVVIDAGDSAGTDGTIAINVYAIDVPDPQSLLVFSDTYKSGSNFTDAILGATTWTKNAGGTTDPTLTDGDSPLGYAHKFNSATGYIATTLTKPSPVHFSVASFFRFSPKTTNTNQTFFQLGQQDGVQIGTSLTHGPFAPTPTITGTSGGSSFQYGGHEPTTYSSIVGVIDNGVGVTSHLDGFGGVANASLLSTYQLGTGNAHVGMEKGTGGAESVFASSYISESAYWPRALNDLAHVASINYCWNRGISLASCNGTNAPTATVTITPTAPAYERPVTCTGSYTLTGASANATSVTWRADPSGDTGTCTGTSSYSCAVAVSPDAAGEGVATVTITATGTAGIAAARQDVGFYVTGARDCFLAQSVDGLNNTTNADNDAVTTWVNLIDSSRNVTQSSAGAKPTVQEGVGSGVYVQPVVRFDGGDRLCDDTAADYVGYSNGSDFHVMITAATTSSNPTKVSHLFATRTTTTTTALGMAITFDDLTANDACRISIGDGSANIILGTCSASALVSGKYHEIAFTLDDDAGGGTDGVLYGNGASLVTPTRSGSYSASSPSAALCLGEEASAAGQSLVGDEFAVIGYAFAPTATQRGINTAVTTWALGNSLPVNP